MGEIQNIYRELQQHIDQSMPVGFPATESGAELRILQHLFSAEDAKLALNLGPLPETLEEIHPRVREIGMTIEELEEKLDSLVMKSIIMGGKLTAGEKGEKRYALAQWAIGMYEFQVDRLTKEIAEDAQQYQNEAYYKEWFKTDTPAQMRTIPIGRSIPAEHYVSTYDNIRSLIENAKGPLSIHNCVCKQHMDLLAALQANRR